MTRKATVVYLAFTRVRRVFKEIDMYRKYSEWYGSTFFLMQKAGPGSTQK